ncbi:MAG: hypothetical protein F4101_10780 [Nitrospira sp. SB0673_bin_12]|nr:hypothetical protein [Nitrospira sp. SB0673_bin_12]
MVESISKAKEPLQAHLVEKQRKPLSAFLDYYLYGRDSVALNLLSNHFDEVEKPLLEPTISDDDRDTRKFWLIIGLIENGDMHKAEELAQDFHPNDHHLLLGIHLGSFLVKNLRITTNRISKKVNVFVRPLTTKSGTCAFNY